MMETNVLARAKTCFTGEKKFLKLWKSPPKADQTADFVLLVANRLLRSIGCPLMIHQSLENTMSTAPNIPCDVVVEDQWNQCPLREAQYGADLSHAPTLLTLSNCLDLKDNASNGMHKSRCCSIAASGPKHARSLVYIWRTELWLMLPSLTAIRMRRIGYFPWLKMLITFKNLP